VAIAAAIATTGVAPSLFAIASSANTAAQAAVAPATSSTTVSASASGGGATVTLSAPATNDLGGTVQLQLAVRGAPTLAALQGNLRYDHDALEVSGAQFAARTAAGTTLQDLQTSDLTDRSALAAWSCPVAACDSSLAGASHASSAASQPIATIAVEPLAGGHVQVRLDGLMLVGSNGVVLARGLNLSLTIDVAHGTRVWSAPQGPATAPTAAATHPASTDIDGDGSTTIRDADMLRQDWMNAAESGEACPAPPAGTDVDGDGCFTIADVETVAAHVQGTAQSLQRAAAPNVVTTFVVNSTGDAADAKADGICQTATAGECTLRAAIAEANRAAGAAEIDFNIPVAAPATIAPGSPLPVLNNPNGISIEGFTQPGSQANTDPLADNAVYGVELVGKGESAFDGFDVSTGHNEFRGLDIHSFKQGIVFETTTSVDNVVEGDMFGLQPDGSLIPGFTYVPSSSCIVLTNGASHNQIGAPLPANRNVISGCGHVGVAFYLWGTKYNNIQNNIIGLDPTGTLARGSISHGVDINTGTQQTMVGGTDPGDGNVVSGNQQHGVEISHNSLTQHNFIEDNFIGTDLTGNNAPAYAANGQDGVHLEGFPNCNEPYTTTGQCPSDAGLSTVTGNVIANNGKGGVFVDKGVHDSVVANNLIGVTLNGTPAGNGLFGVHIEAGSYNNTVGPGNVIANNGTGVQIRPDALAPADSTPTVTNGNTITQNSIYSNGSAGATSLGIDLTPLGQINTPANADPNVQDSIIGPSLASGSPTSVVATTCANCVVEVFVSDRGIGFYGSGKTYLASATADASGIANVTLPAGNGGAVVTATTTNPGGSTSEFAKNIKVATVSNDQPPIAKFTANCDKRSCSFDAGPSHDPDGSIVSYAWDFGDGATGSGITASHDYTANNNYTVQLTVTDNLGAAGVVAQSVTAVDQAPTASFTWSCSAQSCSMNGSSSSDSDGSVVAYAWTFGDGATGTGESVSHQFASAKVFNVTLTVTDDSGQTGSVVVAVDASNVASQGNSVFTDGAHYSVNGTYIPLSGDFNGDGKADIFWYAPGTGSDSIWYSNGTSFQNGPTVNVNGTYKPIVGDFNGDGKADILWYAPGTASDSLWYGAASGFTQGPAVNISGKYKPVVSDFNGDHSDDIVWDNVGANTQTVWWGGASGFHQGSLNLFGPPGTVLHGDFNGDGFGDAFFYQAGSGKEHLWLGSANGPANVSAPSINGTYTPIAGDFNGDGSTDVFFYAPGSGADSMWYGSTTGLHAGPHDSVNGAYVPVAGDFNGDGKTDVFWYAAGPAADSVWYGI
jgi:CSLREA domain-containing protein